MQEKATPSGVTLVTRRRERMPERQYYNVAEVAHIFGISKPSLYVSRQPW